MQRTAKTVLIAAALAALVASSRTSEAAPRALFAVTDQSAQSSYPQLLQPVTYRAATTTIPGENMEDLYKAVVTLKITVGGNWYNCVGVLYQNNFVITAGHCLKDARRVEILFFPSSTGRHAIRMPGLQWKHYPVTGEFVTAENAHTKHDIGIVLFAGAPKWSAPFNSVGPFDPSQNLNAEVFAISRDVGALGKNLSDLRVLRLVNHQRVGNDQSFVMTGSIDRDPQTGNQPATCQGDSGAPVLVKRPDGFSLLGVAFSGGLGVRFREPSGMKCSTVMFYYNYSWNRPFLDATFDELLARQAAAQKQEAAGRGHKRKAPVTSLDDSANGLSGRPAD